MSERQKRIGANFAARKTLLHSAQIILQNRIGATIFQTTFRDVVGLFIICLYLFAPVCQAVHSQATVEAPLADPVLTLNFAVMTRRCHTNTVINYSAIL